MVTSIEKSVYEFAEIERRLRLAEAATARLLAQHRSATGTRRRRRVSLGYGIVGAALGRLASLTRDSRPGLRSREHELAALGVRWDADPAADRALAEETLAARARRRSAPASPTGTGDSGARTAVPRARGGWLRRAAFPAGSRA
jgi:hypothetical protein